jgi:hypothetical protein
MYTRTLQLEAAQAKVRAALLDWLALAQVHSVSVPDQAQAFVAIDANGDIEGSIFTFVGEHQCSEVSL